MRKDISLKTIVDIERWQKVQDHFGEVIGVSVRTVDSAGNPITRPSNPSRLCQEVLRTPAGAALCGKCLPASLDELAKNEEWREGYQCHLGLYNFCIPVIAFDQRAVAYMLIGPVFLGRRREARGYKQKIEMLGLSMDKFIDCVSEVKLFTFTGIHSVIDLISGIACYVAQLGYNRYKLENIIPFPKIGKMVHRYYMDRILNALLEVSFSTVKAEFGSIMLLDEKTGELHIKIAKGLKDEIVRSTRLRIGDGIAGLAVKENRFLLIDDKLEDKTIESRLKRPEIKSAVVAPFMLKDEPLGVMNIATTDPTAKISSEIIDTLHRLVELTETTLTDLLKL